MPAASALAIMVKSFPCIHVGRRPRSRFFRWHGIGQTPPQRQPTIPQLTSDAVKQTTVLVATLSPYPDAQHSRTSHRPSRAENGARSARKLTRTAVQLC